MTTDHDLDEFDTTSKTAQKKAMTALQDIGERLVELNSTKLKKIPLEDNLREAIELAQKMRIGNGRRRQLQYIGKLMRSSNGEEIEAALEELTQPQADHTRLLHQIEHWRERLITQGNNALSEFIQDHPNAERQALSQLVRAAIKEHQTIQTAQQKQQPAPSPKYSRKLFKLLQETIKAQQ